ncbi:MAG: DNA polymerase III subunit delta', partial [Brevundimonas sp.]|nr:DNA polymerase III subunit delta' [Brevundimonas sp.]
MSDERQGLLDGAAPPLATAKLFGHQEAERFLAESYRSGKGHHAILIEGPEGIGKA